MMPAQASRLRQTLSSVFRYGLNLASDARTLLISLAYRCCAGITLLIVVLPFVGLSGCAVQHQQLTSLSSSNGQAQASVASASRAELPQIYQVAQFGVASEQGPMGLLVASERQRGPLLKAARLLLQMGHDTQWYRVDNARGQREHWLLITGLSDRQQARRVQRDLLASPLWQQLQHSYQADGLLMASLPILGLPDVLSPQLNNADQQVADGSPGPESADALQLDTMPAIRRKQEGEG